MTEQEVIEAAWVLGQWCEKHALALDCGGCPLLYIDSDGIEKCIPEYISSYDWPKHLHKEAQHDD